MVTSKTFRHWFLIAAAALCLPAVGIPAAAQQQDQDEEVQMGQEVFNELKAKGEIIESSPLYDQLKPIADAITQAAQPRYNHPFKFYLVHEDAAECVRDSRRKCLCRGFAHVFREKQRAASWNALS